MTTSEWAEALIQLVDIIAWPMVVFGALLLLRRYLPSIGRGAENVLSHRGFTASTPVGTLKVDPPAVERADEAALEGLLSEARPEQRPEIEAALAELRELKESRARVEEVWSTSPLDTVEGRARRIAERARVVLQTPEPAWDGALVFEEIEEAPDGSPILIDQLGSFDGTRAAKALLLVAHSRTWSKGLERAEYLDYVRAAEILAADQIEVAVPPFQPWHLTWAREANGYVVLPF